MGNSPLRTAAFRVMATATLLAVAGQSAKAQATAAPAQLAVQAPGSDTASVAARQAAEAQSHVKVPDWVTAEILATPPNSPDCNSACDLNGQQAEATAHMQEQNAKKGASGWLSKHVILNEKTDDNLAGDIFRKGNRSKVHREASYGQQIIDCKSEPQIGTRNSVQATANQPPAGQTPNPAALDPNKPRPPAGELPPVAKPAPTTAEFDWPVLYRQSSGMGKVLNAELNTMNTGPINPADYKNLTIPIKTANGIHELKIAPDPATTKYVVIVTEDGKSRTQTRWNFYLGNTGGIKPIKGKTPSGSDITIPAGRFEIWIDPATNQVSGVMNIPMTWGTKDYLQFPPATVAVNQMTRTAESAGTTDTGSLAH